MTDFEGDYEGEWDRVEAEVWGINRTDEGWRATTARVHVVVSNRSVREIWEEAFSYCKNLVKVMAPFVEEVGDRAFTEACNLRHASFSPERCSRKTESVHFCLSLEVLAASVGFELDTGDRVGWQLVSQNDANVGITKFAISRSKMDYNKEHYKSATCMIRLCNTPITCSRMRASTDDPIWAYVAGPGRNVAKLIISFACGVKIGKGDLREASKEKLFEVGLELKAIRMDVNDYNVGFWGVIVDDKGLLIKTGVREAVRRGLATGLDYRCWWGLEQKGNGDVYDEVGYYGEQGVAYERIVNGVVVLVVEGFFVALE